MASRLSSRPHTLRPPLRDDAAGDLALVREESVGKLRQLPCGMQPVANDIRAHALAERTVIEVVRRSRLAGMLVEDADKVLSGLDELLARDHVETHGTDSLFVRTTDVNVKQLLRNDQEKPRYSQDAGVHVQ